MSGSRELPGLVSPPTGLSLSEPLLLMLPTVHSSGPAWWEVSPSPPVPAPSLNAHSKGGLCVASSSFSKKTTFPEGRKQGFSRRHEGLSFLTSSAPHRAVRDSGEVSLLIASPAASVKWE